MSFFDFNRALVRTAPASAVHGLRAVDRGPPDLERLRSEQSAYIAALAAAGVSVDLLPALEDFPDSLFVEDAALVFSSGAIVLRPGASSRRGEAATIAPDLAARFDRVLHLTDGTADGGDVLATPLGVFIGVSERTSRDGAAALSELLHEFGEIGRPVATPPGVLHFKSDCSLLDEETVLATPQLAASGAFTAFRTILTPAGEEGAANAVRVGGQLLLSDAYPRTAELLTDRGYRVTPLATAEIAKIDAGLSCMSLRWRG